MNQFRVNKWKSEDAFYNARKKLFKELTENVDSKWALSHLERDINNVNYLFKSWNSTMKQVYGFMHSIETVQNLDNYLNNYDDWLEQEAFDFTGTAIFRAAKESLIEFAGEIDDLIDDLDSVLFEALADLPVPVHGDKEPAEDEDNPYSSSDIPNYISIADEIIEIFGKETGTIKMFIANFKNAIKCIHMNLAELTKYTRDEDLEDMINYHDPRLDNPVFCMLEIHSLISTLHDGITDFYDDLVDFFDDEEEYDEDNDDDEEEDDYIDIGRAWEQEAIDASLDHSNNFEEFSKENDFGEKEQYIAVPYTITAIPKKSLPIVQFSFEDGVCIKYQPFATGAYKQFNNISDFIKDITERYIEQGNCFLTLIREIHNVFVRQWMKMKDKFQNKHYEEKLAKISKRIDRVEDDINASSCRLSDYLYENKDFRKTIDDLVGLVNEFNKTQRIEETAKIIDELNSNH